MRRNHLETAFANIDNLEAQMQETLDESLNNPSLMSSSVHSLIANFLDHLRYIKDVQETQVNTEPPLFYDYFIDEKV